MIYTVENTLKIGKFVRVYVDGKEVKRAFYADTKKGLVRAYDDPLRLHKHGKRALWRTLRGKVEVEVLCG